MWNKLWEMLYSHFLTNIIHNYTTCVYSLSKVYNINLSYCQIWNTKLNSKQYYYYEINNYVQWILTYSNSCAKIEPQYQVHQLAQYLTGYLWHLIYQLTGIKLMCKIQNTALGLALVQKFPFLFHLLFPFFPFLE